MNILGYLENLVSFISEAIGKNRRSKVIRVKKKKSKVKVKVKSGNKKGFKKKKKKKKFSLLLLIGDLNLVEDDI